MENEFDGQTTGCALFRIILRVLVSVMLVYRIYWTTCDMNLQKSLLVFFLYVCTFLFYILHYLTEADVLALVVPHGQI